MPGKERVLGVFDGTKYKAYRISSFNDTGEFFNDNFHSSNFLVYGNSEKNIILAFDISSSSVQKFSKSNQPFPLILMDDKGNHYDIFGEPNIEGVENLKPAKSFIAYWFAWAAFYPTTEVK